MLIQIPQNHSFHSKLTKKIFQETECSIPNWEISVWRKNDLAWSIVLAYLITTNHKDPKDFARRIKNLTGSDKNLHKVKKSISSFNPFRNRYSCFHDETLKNLIEDFKSKFNWKNLFTVSDKLTAASKLLRCRILLIWTDKDTEISRIYSENNESSANLIALYARDIKCTETDFEGRVYNFLLDYQIGFRMKSAALRYFLKEANVPKKMINKAEMLNKGGKHFLISLLSSDCRNIIPTLYKSTYITSKLAEAGYEIDPRSKGSDGLSALYHALVYGDEKILYELYSFAANNCFQSPDYSYRNPDCSIVNNLNWLQEILTTDITKSDFKHQPYYDMVRNTADDLLRVNQFLIKLNSKILKIKTKLNYYETINESVFEARKRRDIVVSILDTYKEYFKRLEKDDPTVSPLGDYLMFGNYYNFIDEATAIIFFDNIIFLKERLVLKDENQFSVIESSFFLLVLYLVVLELVNITDKCKKLHPFVQIDAHTLYIFPLIRRLDNMNKIEEFSKILRDTIINEDCVVQSIPPKEIHNILNSYPIFKDYLLMNRLKRYLKTAVNIKVTDVKSVLVIERVLQVIGENIFPEEDNDNSIRRLFQLILPKAATRILRRTRNELSHIKSYTFKAKAECERNFSFFRSIQSEIRSIQRKFNPLFYIYRNYVFLYFLDLLEEYLKEIGNSPHLYASFYPYPFYLQNDFVDNIKENRYILYQQLCLFYDEIFKNVLCNVEKEISDEVDWTESCERIRSRVLYALWPLKWLIELKIQCQNDNFKTGLDKFKIVENFKASTDPVGELKEKTKDFLITCQDLFSTLNSPRQKRKRKPLKCIENIERFLKILKGFTYLSDEEKDEIRKQIPETIKKDVRTKTKLIESIQGGFSIPLEVLHSEYEFSYLSNKNKEKFFKLYSDKNSEALAVLETPDPIDVLENVFLKNSVDKKKYDDLCCKMGFSEKTKKTLGRLVAGQRKKTPGNSLLNLLNRIQLMKKTIIDENEEICNLWLKVKRRTSRQIITDKIVWLYLRDRRFRSAVEMLLFDCMNIFGNEKGLDNPWIKSSKLYSGINLRIVISHGSPLLESLCKMLDPADLPSDLIQKMIRLIEDEDAIKAILELFRLVDNDYPNLLFIINNEEKEEHEDLKKIILECDEWKTYAKLLPYNIKLSR